MNHRNRVLTKRKRRLGQGIREIETPLRFSSSRNAKTGDWFVKTRTRAGMGREGKGKRHDLAS